MNLINISFVCKHFYLITQLMILNRIKYPEKTNLKHVVTCSISLVLVFFFLNMFIENSNGNGDEDNLHVAKH